MTQTYTALMMDWKLEDVSSFIDYDLNFYVLCYGAPLPYVHPFYNS